MGEAVLVAGGAESGEGLGAVEDVTLFAKGGCILVAVVGLNTH